MIESRESVMKIETQLSITQWADETFGPSSSDARVAARANEEMAELLRSVTSDGSKEKSLDECADVVIILYRLATRLGGDLHDAINKKMSVNRQRKWERDNNGHGYHVREK